MKNLFSYEGKRVVITGASSGMGEATAKLVHNLGGEVIAIDIQSPKYDFAQFIEADLRDKSAIESTVKDIAAGGRINNLFYCAGLPGGKFSNLDVMTVNFIGLRHMVELIAREMQAGDAIALVSSAAGLGFSSNMENIQSMIDTSDFSTAQAWVDEAEKQNWFEPYTISKQCSILYTLRSAELLTKKTGVRINCISPGPTDTGMMPAFVEMTGEEFFEAFPKPIGRNSTSEEQAWPLAFLNSAAASYISGENLYTDGGTSGGIVSGVIDPSIFILM